MNIRYCHQDLYQCALHTPSQECFAAGWAHCTLLHGEG